MDWYALSKKKVDELRKMAKEVPEVVAVSGMSKEELVQTMAKHLGIERPRKVVVGIDKDSVKAEIRALKKDREKALSDKDSTALKQVRKEIHKRKRVLRRAARLN